MEPGQIAVSRARQRNIDGWVARKRPGTGTATAAEAAGAAAAPTNDESGAPPHTADKAGARHTVESSEEGQA